MSHRIVFEGKKAPQTFGDQRCQVQIFYVIESKGHSKETHSRDELGFSLHKNMKNFEFFLI